MERPPRVALSSVVLGAPDPQQLAAFYRRLLGYVTEQDEPGWVRIGPPGGGTGLSFQAEPDHVPPDLAAGTG